MPSPAVIPAPIVYYNIVVVKTLVFYLVTVRNRVVLFSPLMIEVIMSIVEGTIILMMVRE